MPVTLPAMVLSANHLHPIDRPHGFVVRGRHTIERKVDNVSGQHPDGAPMELPVLSGIGATLGRIGRVRVGNRKPSAAKRILKPARSQDIDGLPRLIQVAHEKHRLAFLGHLVQGFHRPTGLV